MTKDEALRLALEVLADLGMKHYENTGEVLYKNTYTAIKAALEAKYEPVQWGVDWNKNGSCASIIKRLPDGCMEVVAVEYGPQRTWVGLTDEEVADIERNSITRRQAIRAIEAKLNEKNT